MAREKLVFTDMTADEIEQKIVELKEELFNLRFRNTMRQLDDPTTIRWVRREIARCRTALSENRKGIRPLVGGSQES